jgi:hypothetical protein
MCENGRNARSRFNNRPRSPGFPPARQACTYGAVPSAVPTPKKCRFAGGFESRRGVRAFQPLLFDTRSRAIRGGSVAVVACVVFDGVARWCRFLLPSVLPWEVVGMVTTRA